MVEIEMNWSGGLAFTGTNEFGHTIITDASPSGGGNGSGFRPTELLLYGIAGCTGIDVVRILEKQRTPLESLTILVTGRQNDTYPKSFHTVEIKYIAKGKGITHEKLASAIHLSESKYCSVSQTVQNETSVTTSFEIIE